jgi:hypothetical protein
MARTYTGSFWVVQGVVGCRVVRRGSTQLPRISSFYGLVIYMYWNERDHPVPHFHAYYAERGASVSVDGVVLAGALDARSLALVVEWARVHREELVANWARGRRNEPLVAIPPLP